MLVLVLPVLLGLRLLPKLLLGLLVLVAVRRGLCKAWHLIHDDKGYYPYEARAVPPRHHNDLSWKLY